MAIKKQFVRQNPFVKLLFSSKEADEVAVIGDFNNWKKEGTLNKLKMGHLKASLISTRMLRTNLNM
jgi:hypothetical protein